MKAQIAVYPYPDPRSDRLQVYFNAADLMAKIDGLTKEHRQQSLCVVFRKISRHELILHIGTGTTGRPINFMPGSREDRFSVETNSMIHKHVADLPPAAMTAVEATVDGNVVSVQMPAKPAAPRLTSRSQRQAKTSSVVKSTEEIYIRDEIVTVPAALADFIMRQHSR